jgi:hypothetical protein
MITHRVYCLECNAVIGEEPEPGEAEHGDRLDVCQTCAQHRGPGEGSTAPASDEQPGSSV